MSENAKKIKEIFSDYETNSNLKYASITALNVIKKTNTLEVDIYFDEYIEIKEIWYFEKFLQERFKFKDITLKINYHESVKLNSIETEWKNIIAYMAHKYPLTKPMLLLKSNIEVEENTINVKMHIKGAEFLKAKKTDKELEKVLKNLFGKDYKVNLTEELSNKDIQEIKNSIENVQKEAIAHIEEENKEKATKEENKYNIPEYVPQENLEGYEPKIPQELTNIPIDENIIETKEEQKYILGKPSKAKEKLISIKDITASEERITLEGRIVSQDLKETRTGKGMLIFDIYDKTGIITCKSFTKDIKEGNEVIEKIKNAKSIKIIGKAGLDTYQGDVTIISNTIIETAKEFPNLPQEDDSSPLILGNTLNITDPLVKISELGVDDGKVSIDGEVIGMEDKETKSGKTILSLDIYDGSSTMTCKAFLNKDNSKKVIKRIKNAKGIKIAGTAQMDTFSNELTVMINTIIESNGIKKEIRQDNSEVKRVELHMHTQMSQMDAMTSATDLIKRAMKWGMKSIAITDHGVVQAFPEAHKLLRI